MSELINDRRRDLLRAIAGLRVVTIKQLACLSEITPRAVCTHVNALVKQELVQSGIVMADGGRGRPERILSITAHGVKALRAEGFDIPANAAGRLTAYSQKLIQHQLLVSEFRVQLKVMTRTWPEFQAQILTPGDSAAETGDDAARAILLPDAVIGLHHTGLGRTLLFFLEADRGTETLISSVGTGDIRQKIEHYQSRFRSGEYKLYQQKFNAELIGFRVLFLTDRQPRLAPLCRVVRETPPSDFVWLTDEVSLSARGVGAPIWVRGGHMDRPRQSILGSKVPAALQDPAPNP